MGPYKGDGLFGRWKRKIGERSSEVKDTGRGGEYEQAKRKYLDKRGVNSSVMTTPTGELPEGTMH